ncbi:HAMP domain-containing protein [Cystobacter fuscus]
MLVRMPWNSGPCAFVLVRISERPGPGPSWYSPIPPEFWLLPTVMSLVGVLLALGPVVRRLRQLTGEVKVFVRSTYQGPITVHGDDEISELARAFDEAGRAIHAQIDLKEKREQTLRTFLQNTTHDVMIPLTVLQGHRPRCSSARPGASRWSARSSRRPARRRTTWRRCCTTWGRRPGWKRASPGCNARRWTSTPWWAGASAAIAPSRASRACSWSTPCPSRPCSSSGMTSSSSRR